MAVCAMQEYTHEIRWLSIKLMDIITKIILLFLIASRSRLLSNEDDTQDSTHNILTSSLKDIREHSAIYLPKLDSLKQIQKARKRALHLILLSFQRLTRRQVKETVFFYMTLVQVVEINTS